MTLDRTDDEKAALVAHLRHALEYEPYPFAPRLDPLSEGDLRAAGCQDRE
jgi:hypothetical protein